MKVLVFGANGQVGQELQLHPGVTALTREDADLSMPGECSAAVQASDADVVINAAAFTSVDRAESEEDLANRVNGAAPGEIARACASLGIPFVHVSTDYVFDGSGDAPHSENEKPFPLNAYGRSKLNGETGVRTAGGHWAILRTSWVFSSHGGNFVRTMLRLGEAHEQLRIVSDQFGGPTPARDIATALIAIGRAMHGGHPGGIYHFAGQPNVTWADFAREILEQADFGTHVEPILTAEYPTPAQRPLNSRLECEKITQDFGVRPPEWKLGLASVLKDLEVLP